MAFYALRKKILSFTGGAEEFLNGLSANAWDAPKNAFLDVQGRIVATADQVRVGGDEVWEAVEEPFAERLLGHLQNHLRLSDTRAAEVGGIRAYFDLDGTAPAGEGEYRLPQVSGQILLTPRERRADVSEEAFTRFRLDHRLPLQGADYDREMLLNLGDDAYVSFSKGCFLGQEIIARVRYRGRPPRRLEVARLDPADARIERMTSRVRDEETGKIRGFLFLENT